MLPRTSTLKHFLTMPLAALGVLAMLIEEFLWDLLVAFGNWLGSLEFLRNVEVRIRALPPAAAGVALLAPVTFFFPVKVLAVYAMASGHIGLGLMVLLTAKVVGTAMVARIYTLCEPALMTMTWFVRVRGWILAAKDWAHRKLESWPPYRWMRRQLYRMRCALKRILRGAQELG